MNRIRSVAEIRLDLDTALEYRRRYSTRPSVDPLVTEMRVANEVEIARLEAELKTALSGTLEISLDGQPIQDHHIAVPYLSRVLDSLQSVFRAAMRSLDEGRVRRADATLAVTSTAPGSFRVALATPPTQLRLDGEPLSDRALEMILDLLSAAAESRATEVARTWAEQSDEAAVRSMTRFAATLASSRGTTHLRVVRAHDSDRLVRVTANAARDLAVALAGEAGREIITVVGHLQMAQDEPRRARIRTDDDEYLARIRDDQLDLVKSLLFEQVSATLVIDMRTSVTTGSPDTDIELLDLMPAAGAVDPAVD
ncbi:MAG TPA: hypothetical protein VMD59_21405 [Acidimicrobiales bacterium]|nr:hypothetical protein [Acidimicrobiales bacterium]